MITKVVLYYRGQCSSANATVGVGVGMEVTIGLLYRLRDVGRGGVEMSKKENMTRTITSYTTLIQ